MRKKGAKTGNDGDPDRHLRPPATGSHQDPAAMTAEDRLCEIATILALGYIRLRISRQSATQGAGSGPKALDVHPESKASCGSLAHSPESEDAA